MSKDIKYEIFDSLEVAYRKHRALTLLIFEFEGGVYPANTDAFIGMLDIAREIGDSIEGFLSYKDKLQVVEDGRSD